MSFRINSIYLTSCYRCCYSPVSRLICVWTIVSRHKPRVIAASRLLDDVTASALGAHAPLASEVGSTSYALTAILPPC